ncbi:MAG: polyprenol monophosphomannose synthase [Chloroflexi bacterium]|nr:polyprenol monophosphomannose synthase [Chloroflexota bacterium]
MTSLIVLPTYNERANLARIVPSILAQGDFHVLVVDDSSPDGTGKLADQLAATANGRVAVIHRAGKLGLGTAYIAGFKYALAREYEYIFEMDADFSHNPAYLPHFLAAIRHADVVIGSRYIRGGGTQHWSFIRQLISRGAGLYTRLVLGLPVSDPTSGFKCFRRAVLAALNLDSIRSNGYSFQIEMNWRCYRKGFRIAEVPIVFPDRAEGQSKMSGRIVLEAMWVVWKLRFDRCEPASEEGAILV